MKKLKKKSGLILSNAFKRLQHQNAGYSMRALAKKVGVSHVFMGKLLRGETPVPLKRLSALTKALQLDDLAMAQLKSEILAQVFNTSRDLTQAKDRLPESGSEVYVERSTKYFTAIENWFELPLLELLTCTSYDGSVESAAKALRISPAQTKDAVERLKRVGLIVEREGRLIKSERYIRFPTKIPQPVTKKYYQQVLKKAFAEFDKTSGADFEKRSMTNLSLAINPAHLPAAKERLQKFLYELSLELTDGDASQVYFLASFLFPVSDKI